LILTSQQKPLNISLIVSDLSSTGAGRWGGAVRPFLLAQALQKLGHHVKLFGLAYETGATPVKIEDYSLFSLSCPYYVGLPKFIPLATKLLSQIDGDVIYAVKLKPTSFGLALLKKMANHRPVIVDIDDWEMSWFGGDEWRYPIKFKQLYRDLFKPAGILRHPDNPLCLRWMESLLPHADGVTRHTQFIGKRFGGVYIPNGKDVALFDPQKYDPEASRAKYGLSEYQVLMFPGAPRPYKGLETVLTALDLLDRPDLRLVIVGGSPYDDYDRQLIERWGRWMIKLPRTPVQLMPEVVSAAHAIVVPQMATPASLAQFPLKLIDGMAMAKPILATQVGDIPEILNGTGYLVEPNAPEQVAEQIRWIFAHPDEAQTKGWQARQRCVEFYSLEAMATILSGVLQSLPS
jgi:glycosyltransferase involved in cell wall biosynthesis